MLGGLAGTSYGHGLVRHRDVPVRQLLGDLEPAPEVRRREGARVVVADHDVVGDDG